MKRKLHLKLKGIHNLLMIWNMHQLMITLATISKQSSQPEKPPLLSSRNRSAMRKKPVTISSGKISQKLMS
jgi:hypothetical protein